MPQRPTAQVPVSPNNPCPFLRALVAEGYLDGHIVPLAELSATIAQASGEKGLEKIRARMETYGVALFANGNPLRSIQSGAVLDELRDGPLDKHGVGSRILDAGAHVHEEEIDRFASFGQECEDPSGGFEPGLTEKQVKDFMSANRQRGKDKKRWYDWILMQGEWPILLRVMGKGQGSNRYLSVAEVRTLFVERRLPDRIAARLPPRIP